MVTPFGELTWRCDACGEVRPDARISVHKVDIGAKHGLPPGTMQHNKKYCNDNADCLEKVAKEE
jgi:hypothetical protein